MDWKSIAIFHSFQTSGWLTKSPTTQITRLLACTDEQLSHYKGLDIGKDIGKQASTFVFTDQQSKPGYEDSPTYNKPAGIMHFTQTMDIDQEFILFVDADMLLRYVIHPSTFHAKKGTVISEWVWYVQSGIQNGLSKQFLSDSPNPDAVANSYNTHGGYYHLFHKDDAKKVAPLWLHYTKQMRHHPEKYFAKLKNSKLIYDIDVEQKGGIYGEAPWISELYGYAFAAAEVGLEHKFTRGGGGVLYGDDFLTLNHDGPFLSHYTLSCHIPSIEIFKNKEDEVDEENDYLFDKNEFRDFDPMDCNDGFLFPRADTLLVDEGAASCFENVERINHALCEFYKRRCSTRPHSRAYQNAIRQCPWDTNAPFNLHYEKVKPAPCGNQNDEYCHKDVLDGRCKDDPAYMQLNCLEACGFCATMQPQSNKYTQGHGHSTNGKGHEEKEMGCHDLETPEVCKKFANEMDCVLNPSFMVVHCRKTCGKCPTDDDHLTTRASTTLISDSTTNHAATTTIASATASATQKEFSFFKQQYNQNPFLFILVVVVVVMLLFVWKVISWRRFYNTTGGGRTKKGN
jgi:hypothetical protein